MVGAQYELAVPNFSAETIVYDKSYNWATGNGMAVIDQDTKLRDIKLYGWEE